MIVRSSLKISDTSVAGNILVSAIWFGLVCGIFEGIIFLITQRFGRVMHVNIQILGVSALVDLILFFFLGLGLAAVVWITRRRWIISLVLFIFIFLILFDWIGVVLWGRLQNYAIIALAAGVAVELIRRLSKNLEGVFRFFQRTLPWVILITVLILFGTWAGLRIQEQIATSNLPSAAPDLPNILVVVVDTLRADHLSSYGYTRLTSPGIDRIAEQGVLFENAIATSAYTLPSHVSLLTGRFTYEHGVEWDSPKVLFDSPYPTLAEELSSYGYRTGAFSANLFWFTREFGFGRGFIHFEDYFKSVGDMFFRTAFGRIVGKVVLPRLGYEDIPARKMASDINQSVLKWLDKDTGHPYFIFLNYMDTHDPYLAPQPYRSQYSAIEEPGGILNCLVGRCEPELTEEERQAEIDAYDGTIAYVDANIDELLSDIDRRNLLENTLILILSDHGEAFGEHDIYLHDNSLYREVLHVPLIIRWPNQIPAGERVTTPVTIAALPVTIMDLLGKNEHMAFPGQSLKTLWENSGENPNWLPPLAEMAQKPFAPKEHPVHYGAMRSLVTPYWHYIENEALGIELFNWEDDPIEAHNLSQNPSLVNIEGELKRELNQILRGE